MKKLFFTAITCILVSVGLLASPVKEKQNITVAVMQGPTGFSSAGLPDNIEVELYPSPVEAVSNLVNGSIQFAVIPANKAAALYAGGMDIQVIAIVGEGMLSIVGTDKDSSELYVPGIGDTPDLMAGLLYLQYERNYGVSAPAQLAQLVIAEKAKLAILPQPFVNKILAANKNARIFSDVKDEWVAKTGEIQFPMSVLVAKSDYIQKNGKTVSEVKSAYEKSVKWVIENPSAAGEKIEASGIMSKDLASLSIKDCELVFKDSQTMKKELQTYFKVINVSVPDDGFYFL